MFSEGFFIFWDLVWKLSFDFGLVSTYFRKDRSKERNKTFRGGKGKDVEISVVSSVMPVSTYTDNFSSQCIS